MAFETAGTGTDLAGALEVLRRVVTKRAVVFLISDFQADGYEKTLRVVNLKHDLVAIAISDPREAQLPNAGLIAVKDAETGRPTVDRLRPHGRAAAVRGAVGAEGARGRARS